MFFTVDRVIPGGAVLVGEDGKTLKVSVHMLPQGAKEGEMLFYGKDGFTLAPEKTAERRSRMAGMLGELLRGRHDKDE